MTPEELFEVNLKSTVVCTDERGHPIYIWEPGQTRLEAYQDALYGGPGWRLSAAKMSENSARNWAAANGKKIVDEDEWFGAESRSKTIAYEWASKNGKKIISPDEITVVTDGHDVPRHRVSDLNLWMTAMEVERLANWAISEGFVIHEVLMRPDLLNQFEEWNTWKIARGPDDAAVARIWAASNGYDLVPKKYLVAMATDNSPVPARSEFERYMREQNEFFKRHPSTTLSFLVEDFRKYLKARGFTNLTEASDRDRISKWALRWWANDEVLQYDTGPETEFSKFLGDSPKRPMPTYTEFLQFLNSNHEEFEAAETILLSTVRLRYLTYLTSRGIEWTLSTDVIWEHCKRHFAYYTQVVNENQEVEDYRLSGFLPRPQDGHEAQSGA